MNAQASILDFFPQDQSMLLNSPKLYQHILELAIYFLQLLKETREHLLLNDFAKFDAQVGETLCQIRAYKTYELLSQFHNLKHDINLDEEIERTEYVLLKIQNQNFKKFNKHYSLKQFLEENNLLFPISQDLIYLAMCYTLCKYALKENNKIPVGINFEAVSNSLKKSKHFTKKLIQYFQKYIADISCQFIVNKSNDVDKLPVSEILLKYMKKISDEGRSVLPNFDVTKIIYKSLILKNIPCLLLLISRDSKLLVPYIGLDKTTNKIASGPIENFCEMTSPAIVFLASVSSIINNGQDFIEQCNQLINHGLDKLIYCSSATHPQYSGANLIEYRDNHYEKILSDSDVCCPKELDFILQSKEEFEFYRHTAKKLNINKHECYVDHIYCSNVRKELTFFASEGYNILQSNL